MIIFICLFVIGIVPLIYYIFEKIDPTTKQEDTDEQPILPVVDDVDYLTPKLTESYLTLDNYVGQSNVVKYVKMHIKHSKEINSPLPHILLWGPGGLGKSTFVKAIAHEMGGRFIELVPANLSSIKELHSIFFLKKCVCGHINPYTTNSCLRCKEKISIYFTPVLQIEEMDIIFLEECHGLKDDIEEALYSLMQDGYVMLRYNGVDQRIQFPKITIAGATTLKGDLNLPFRDRFKLDVKLEPYKPEDMFRIAQTYINHKGATFTEAAIHKLTKVSVGTPRVIKKYCDDLIAMGGEIDAAHFNILAGLLGLDDLGLSKTHRNILGFIHKRMQTQKNGGAGSQAVAKACSIKEKDYLEFFEPALIYHDLIYPDSRGRRLTEKGLNLYFKGWFEHEGKLKKA